MPTKSRKLRKAAEAAKAHENGETTATTADQPAPVKAKRDKKEDAPIIDATKAGREASAAKKNPERTPEKEMKSLDKAGIDKAKKVVMTAKVKDEKGNVVNPKQVGSQSRIRFDLYGKGGATVAEYLHKGVRSEDIRWDVAHGFIELQ